MRFDELLPRLAWHVRFPSRCAIGANCNVLGFIGRPVVRCPACAEIYREVELQRAQLQQGASSSAK